MAKKLENALGYHVFYEPVTENPYLARFYQDPHRYALPMQIWLLRQRFHTYITALLYHYETGKGIILDRSIFSDEVFALKNYRDGNITKEGYEEYLRLREQMLAVIPLPDTILYLDVPPESCLYRIRNVRGRDCESTIPLEYLIGLDECYHLFLEQMQKLGCHVLSIQWKDFGDEVKVATSIRRCTSPTPPAQHRNEQIEELKRWDRQFLAEQQSVLV